MRIDFSRINDILPELMELYVTLKRTWKKNPICSFNNNTQLSFKIF